LRSTQYSLYIEECRIRELKNRAATNTDSVKMKPNYVPLTRSMCGTLCQM